MRDISLHTPRGASLFVGGGDVDEIVIRVIRPTERHLILSTRPRSDLIRATLHSYATFEDVCRAAGGYGERVEWPRISRLPSSAPLQ